MDNMDYRLRCSGVFLPVKDAVSLAEDAEFRESDHPRSDDGKFTSGGGGGGKADKGSFEKVNKAIEIAHKNLSSLTKGGPASEKGELGISNVEGLVRSLQGGAQYNAGNLHKITEGLLRDAELTTKQKNALVRLKKGLEEGVNYSSANVLNILAAGKAERAASSKERAGFNRSGQPAKVSGKEREKFPKDMPVGERRIMAGVIESIKRDSEALSKATKPSDREFYAQQIAEAKKRLSERGVTDCATTLQALKERVAKDGGPGSGRHPEGGSNR